MAQYAQAEAKYRTLMAAAADGILLVDRQGEIVEANEAATRVTGYELDDLIGMRLAQFLPGEGFEWLRQQAGQADELNPVSGLEGIAQRRDGTQFPFEASVNELPIPGQEFYWVILRDTSERSKSLQEALRAERMRALGQVASGVAHDFNNLLGAILGRTQLLMMKLGDPAAQRALQVIEQAALDGAETARRIQRFARSQQAEDDFVPVDPNVLVEDVIETTRYRWRDQAQREDVVIHVEPDLCPAPTIMANPAELRQLLANLVINACDALPTGGRITISTRADAATVAVSVADTGKGMPPEVQERVFEPFFSTKNGNNSGLGLNLGREIACRHGGDLSVDSTVNQGTTFTLALPRSDEVTPTIAETTIATNTTRAQVLVVDDEPVLCELVVEMLETLGHQAVAATSCEQALHLLNTDTFDVVITDLGMPHISGWRIAEAVKQSQPDTYVILLTGWDNPLSGQPARQVDEVLTKPVTIADLAAAINAGLAQRLAS